VIRAARRRDGSRSVTKNQRKIVDFWLDSLHKRVMSEVSKSQTPLRASFRIRLNGEPVVIETIGQAYRFITSLNTVEWMEFKALHADAKAALKAAAEDAMLSVKATNTLRELFVRAKLL
jgi:hypothetical protein